MQAEGNIRRPAIAVAERLLTRFERQRIDRKNGTEPEAARHHGHTGELAPGVFENHISVGGRKAPETGTIQR